METTDTLGLVIVKRIFLARNAARTAGKQFTVGDAAAIADETIDELLPEKKPRARNTKPYAKMTDEEFVAFLEAEPHLKGVDVKREIGKCQFWCRCNNKLPSRMRVINWLNKSENILGYNAAGASSIQAKTKQGFPEPAGWRNWVRENLTDPSWAEKEWQVIEPAYQKHIADSMNKNI
jgi:hypothetical protein